MNKNAYKDFMASLLPTIDPDTILGLKMSEIKKMMKYYPDEQASFLQVPHTYFEENHLHALLIQYRLSDFDAAMKETLHFLPYIDNWAVCDSFRPKALKSDPERLLLYIHDWLQSDHVYTIRLGLVLLLNWYLDENFKPVILDWVQAIDSKEYYVCMACSWFWSIALIKQYERVIPYFTSNRLPLWIHNKAIQKACESLQVSKEDKTYLKSLKRKK